MNAALVVTGTVDCVAAVLLLWLSVVVRPHFRRVSSVLRIVSGFSAAWGVLTLMDAARP